MLSRYPSGTRARTVVPAPGLRIDSELAVDQIEPLLHADEAQPLPLAGPLGIESHAFVDDIEVNRGWRAAQHHGHLRDVGVAERVGQRFLQNTKQADGSVR